MRRVASSDGRQLQAAYDVIAIGASAGGVSALIRVLGGLPASLPAAVVIVLHLDPRTRSRLVEVLGRRTALAVCEAAANGLVRPGAAFVAPPNHHLLVEPGGRLALSDSRAVHSVRPSADVLFVSVASSYGPRAIAVILTGSGCDGAAGIVEVKRRGGVTIAQDATTSEFFGMPGAAIATGAVDLVLPLGEIPAALAALVAEGRAP
jgi:two-component system chemotaxis response regulator CheB